MELKRKTPSGTLVTRYNQSDEYPGFWVDLWEKNKGMQPVHIIPISLADCMKG